MSKNELRVAAKIILFATGLYVVVRTLLTTITSFAAMPFMKSEKIEIPLTIMIFSIYIVILLVIGFFLIRGANRISEKIIDNEPVDYTQVSGIATAFRIICVIIGVLMIYWSFPRFIITVYQYFVNLKASDNSEMRTMYMGMSSISEIVKDIILLGLAAYLAYGAPAFVRWQVRMTLKQCNKILEEQQPS